MTKYPRTPHLTFSPGCTNDDKMLDTNDYFLNREIVITAKLDGSNVFMSKDNIFARSHASTPKHASFDLAKQAHSDHGWKLWPNICLYMEYTFAKHAIHYTNLPSYFNLFAVLDAGKEEHWLSWKEVEISAEIMNRYSKPWLATAPVLFNGIVKTDKELKKLILSLMQEKEFGTDVREGVVVRMADEFKPEDFSKSVAKYVRAGHVDAGDDHWSHKEIIRNGLAK